MSKRNRRTKVASPSASYPGPIERGLSKREYKNDIEGSMYNIMYGWGGADVSNVTIDEYGVNFEFTGYASLPFEEEDEPSEEYYEEESFEEYSEEQNIPSQQQRILDEINGLLKRLKSLLEELHSLDPDDADAPLVRDDLKAQLAAVNTVIRDTSSDLYGDALDEFKTDYQAAVVSVGGAWTREEDAIFDARADELQAEFDKAQSFYILKIVPAQRAIADRVDSGEVISFKTWKELKAEYFALVAQLDVILEKLTESYQARFYDEVTEGFSRSNDGWNNNWANAMEEAEEAASAVNPGDYLMENGSPIPNAVFLAGFIKGIEKARKDKKVQEKYGKDYKTGDPLPPSEIFKWIYNSARGWARNVDKLSAAQRDGLNTPLGLRKPKAQRSGVASPIIKAEIYKEISKLKGVNKASLPGKAKFVAEFGFSEGYQDQDSNEAYAHSNHKRKKASLLREATIKLAHSNPELRKHLIPLLMEDED